MAPKINPRRTCDDAKSRQSHAFTLIELLTVMAIIVVLAGLVLGTVGLANNKAAKARTQSEIKELEVAINSYQSDMAAVPRTSDTDKIDPKVDVDSSKETYRLSSLALYQALSGYYYYDADGKAFAIWKSGGSQTDAPKTYKTFKSSQLNKGDTANLVNGNIPPDKVTSVSDGFGLYYGYSTIYQAKLEANPNSATPPTQGYNPTYDLWSTGGYTPSTGGGKTYPADMSTAAAKSTLWITNWGTQ